MIACVHQRARVCIYVETTAMTFHRRLHRTSVAITPARLTHVRAPLDAVEDFSAVGCSADAECLEHFVEGPGVEQDGVVQVGGVHADLKNTIANCRYV